MAPTVRYFVYSVIHSLRRFRELADSGLLHGKQFRVGFGQSWVHTRLEGGEGGATAAAGLYFITQRKKRRVSSVSLNFMSSRGNVREFIKTVSSF